ncbi:uncharacterized protein LOC142532375 [Primulina tabacum]|uniref:uncharacterized protein LOC142532375 n=1 Tax=Primulina tabacum TaxID=48773 RepID=UPI003F5AD2A2
MVRFDFDDEVCSDGGHELDIGTLNNSIDAWIHCIRGVGRKFKDAAEFRICLKNNVIASRRFFSYKRNESGKILVVCSKENCEWKIYASKHKSDNSFCIRKCNLSHSCGDDNLRIRGHPKADSSWVANVVKEKLRGEPSYHQCTMLKEIERDYGIELEYHKVWGVKRWQCMIFMELIRSRMINYDVVDAENDSNWEWFCYQLKHVLASQYIMIFRSYIFYSDRHPGLIKAIQYVFPSIHHSYCLRHMVDNFVKQVLCMYHLHNKKHWSSVLKKIAYTPSRHEFSQHMKSIIDSMSFAQEFLVSVSTKNWANSMFVGERWGVINKILLKAGTIGHVSKKASWKVVQKDYKMWWHFVNLFGVFLELINLLEHYVYGSHFMFTVLT